MDLLSLGNVELRVVWREGAMIDTGIPVADPEFGDTVDGALLLFSIFFYRKQ